MLRLTVTCADRILRFPLPAGEVRLGSAADNDLVLPLPGVSRHHALVRPVPGGLLLIDQKSKNGLVIEGLRVQEVLLEPGGTVQVGRAFITLEQITSSDAEIALTLGPLPGHSSTRGGVWPTDALLAGEGTASPACALQLIRDIESLAQQGLTRPRSDLLRDAAAILGAEAILVYSLDRKGEIAIADLYGPMPDDAQARALAQSARCVRPARGDVPHEGGTAGPLLVTASADRKVFLAAWLPAPVPDTGSWREAFLEYLSGKLFGAAEPAGSPACPTLPEVLIYPPGMVPGNSPAIQVVLERLRATVRSRLDVLLLGDTGTGKELFARLIHASGPTAAGPFVAINCAAIAGDLLEAELFGVLGRVATGVDARPGLFVQADGGTIFLDEIGDMPARLQAKLLRVLQEREVLPVGGSTARKIDVRVVSASNRDLPRMVGEGGFRADLYYRLRGVEIRIPPLRERREDLPAMALTFASRAAERYGKKVRGISRRALRLLLDHPWPGNIRELESVIEEAVLRCPRGGVLESEHFHLGTTTFEAPKPPPFEATETVPPPAGAGRFASLQERVETVEREAIMEALKATKGRKTTAARMLGLTRQGLTLKIARLKIDI